MKLKVLTLFLLIVTGRLSAGLAARAQPSIIDQMIRTQNAMVEIKALNTGVVQSGRSRPVLDPKTGRLTVMHRMGQAAYQRFGAGVIIHPSGIIVTNAHNIMKAKHIRVTLHNRKELPARIVRVVPNLDMALLKISAKTTLVPVALANSDELQLGDEIITIGNSTLLSGAVSGGRVIGLGTSKSARGSKRKRVDLIQTNVNIYSGDSGGPLFDREGRLIGLMTAKEMDAERSSFAIPSNKIIRYLMEYLNETHLDSESSPG